MWAPANGSQLGLMTSLIASRALNDTANENGG